MTSGDPPLLMTAEEVRQWTVAEVSRNLEAFDWADAHLRQRMYEHEVDGTALLELKKRDLKYDLGVKALGKVKRILRCLAGIRRTSSVALTDAPIRAEDLRGQREEKAEGDEPPDSIALIPRPPPPSPPEPTGMPHRILSELDEGLGLDCIELEDLRPECPPSGEGDPLPPRPVTAIGHRPTGFEELFVPEHRHVWADDPPEVDVRCASDLKTWQEEGVRGRVCVLRSKVGAADTATALVSLHGCPPEPRLYFVASDRCSRAALKAEGVTGGRFDSACIVLLPTFPHPDSFLRELGLRLHTQSPAWDPHRRSQLWVCLGEDTPVPSILTSCSVVIDLEDLDDLSEVVAAFTQGEGEDRREGSA